MGDAKSVIRNVYKVCEEEKTAGKLAIPLENVCARTSHYTGRSMPTCWRARTSNSEKPRRKRRSDRYSLDSFDRDVIRRTINEMITEGKCLPTAKRILKEVRTKIDFPRKLTFLRQILKEMGFQWRKCGSTRSILMERADIVVARVNFLRQIENYRKEGRPIVYCDETFVHSSHVQKKCWQSEDVSVNVPFSKGERLIIVHAGSASGFIKNASLIFKSGKSSGDYHDEMNFTNFNQWLTEKLIPNLPPASVLVVDNAPYHNVQVEKCPTSTTRKGEIQSWLERHNIKFNQQMLKAELLELCKRNKPKPIYVLDKTLEEHGHVCLRLPQYHAELNAIELIWANVKKKVASANVTFKYKDVMKLTQDAIDSITPKEWFDCCRHVIDIEKRFKTDDVRVERAIDKFIIEVDCEETDTASEVEDDDSEETDTASDDGLSTDTASEYNELC